MTEEYGGFVERVELYLARDGGLKAVGGVWVSHRDSASTRKTPVTVFLLDFWKQVGGAAQNVADYYSGLGSYGNRSQIAKFSGGGAKGEWTSYPPCEAVKISLD